MAQSLEENPAADLKAAIDRFEDHRRKRAAEREARHQQQGDDGRETRKATSRTNR